MLRQILSRLKAPWCQGGDEERVMKTRKYQTSKNNGGRREEHLINQVEVKKRSFKERLKGALRTLEGRSHHVLNRGAGLPFLDGSDEYMRMGWRRQVKCQTHDDDDDDDDSCQ